MRLCCACVVELFLFSPVFLLLLGPVVFICKEQPACIVLVLCSVIEFMCVCVSLLS